MKNTIMYLKSVFGNKIVFLYNEHQINMPFYMEEHFTFLKFMIDGNAEQYLLVKPNEKIEIKIDSIHKLIVQIKNYTNCFPIMVFDELRLTQRDALIQAGFPFVVPKHQIFIPVVMYNLIERNVIKKEYKSKFSISTQVVFIYMLLNDVVEINARGLLNELPYSVATMNRSLNELSDRGLLNVVGNNTRKKYRKINNKEFWEKGKQFLFNPVEKRYYTKNYESLDGLLFSNESALSKLSESLNESRTLYFAAASEEVKKIKNCFIQQYDIFDDYYCVVEQFKYNPQILSSSDCIDIVSLYAQFKDCKDERVQIALDEIMGEIIC